IAMTRYMKRGGKVFINIYPDRPLTKKPAEVRMGSGKGSVEWWVANIKPGRVMFEVAGVDEEVAREALRLAMHKLPTKCRILSRVGGDIGWQRPSSPPLNSTSWTTPSWPRSWRRPRTSCSSFVSSPRPASSRPLADCGPSRRTSRGSTRSCVSASWGSVRLPATPSDREARNRHDREQQGRSTGRFGDRGARRGGCTRILPGAPLPQDPAWVRGLRQDGQDRRGRGRGPCQACALRQGHEEDLQVQGP